MNIFSPAIIQYLAEEYTDKQGMGSTLSEQIRAMSTMHWAHNTLQRCVITNYVYVMMKNSELSDPEAAMALTQTAKTDIRQHLQTLDTHYLGKSKFLFGNDCLFVDCFVAMLLTTLDLVSFDFKPFPRVKQWMTNVKQLYEDNWEEVCETHNMQVMQRGSRRASLM
ncbi:uncharacterized protein LOC112042616 [Lingula anatina]|uniref:Uncharacterized protein LOC112042616 n=1 Tax=Lingula anatina TaxID=7574 RepID=A0A2R2MSG3_LINAN|nr:uncharacterized protein LOC112042616 [Lingula anatina]|eukprot:XP_023933205.1 uncharacterized protein LOC112042616 [Lingula anatina]